MEVINSPFYIKVIKTYLHIIKPGGNVVHKNVSQGYAKVRLHIIQNLYYTSI